MLIDIIPPRISKYFSMFSLNTQLLNFNAIKGISATNKKENIIVNPMRRGKLLIKTFAVSLSSPKIQIKGIVMKKSVFAGVGKPMKEFDCLVSILNLARRKAEKTVTIYPKNGR